MSIRTPRLYRYLEKKYAEAFFSEGHLRLSSFERFRTHVDETRMDLKEGFAQFIHRTSEGQGETLIIDYECFPNVYSICASALPSRKLMSKFSGADSAIVIWDPIGFEHAVTMALNNVVSVKECIQGPCSYQFRRVVERDLGYLGIAKDETSDPSKMDPIKLEAVVSKVMTNDVYFLKREAYVDEAEYRFVWLIDGVADQVIDLVVPEARQYCARWEDQGEWIAIDNVESAKQEFGV